MEVRKAFYLKNPISSEMGVGQNELLTMIRVDSYEAIGKTFESVLESALEQGYPIDYAPTKRKLPLLLEALHLSDEAAMYLIDAGADVNAEDKYQGRSVLIKAIDNRCAPCVIKKILDRTSDVNHKDDLGYSALKFFCFRVIHQRMYFVETDKNNFAVLDMLLKAGADTSVLDNLEIKNLGKYSAETERKMREHIALFKQQQEELSNNNNCIEQSYDYEL